MSKSWGGGRWRKRRNIYWRGWGWKKRHSSVKQKTWEWKENRQNRWLKLSSLWRRNKLRLSNQLQPLCHKSSLMRGTMTLSSLRSLSFLHAFLFWRVLMNDLKSDLFPSLCQLSGRKRRGEEPEGSGRDHTWRFPVFGPITHQAWILCFIHEGKTCHCEAVSPWNRIDYIWRIRGETVTLLCGGRVNWRIIFTEHHTSHHSSQNHTPQLVPWN